jgi:hypothetical protein
LDRFFVAQLQFFPHFVGEGDGRRHYISAMSRRFPPPWSVEEQEACFVVRDSNGQALVYVYFEDEPGDRSQVAHER